MSKKKPADEKLSVNLLVPFTGADAEAIKRFAGVNGLHNTVLIRMLIRRGLEDVKNGKPLTLLSPKDGEAA
jgi:hypothetical protein